MAKKKKISKKKTAKTDKEIKKLISSIPDTRTRILTSVMLLTEDVGSQEARIDAIGDSLLLDLFS